MQITAVGIVLDQPILIVGAMVVGPEFVPLAAISVALVNRQAPLARRSLLALAVGFPLGIVATLVTSLVFIGTGAFESEFAEVEHEFTRFISNPDFLSFFVAFVAGSAGVLSLTAAKSGALVGVLISVTTIPAASNVGVAAAYGQWGDAKGAAIQLAINLSGIVASGLLTLFVQPLLRGAPAPPPDGPDPHRGGPPGRAEHARHTRPPLARAKPRCRSSSAPVRSPRL
jgi:uncharacterized hydrophobic protein (TIGR00271 family)